MRFTTFFETVLEEAANGIPLTQIINNDPRDFDYDKIRSWIMADPTRTAQYYEAQRRGAGAIEDELITIADGTLSPEEVARSKLRIDTRKFVLATWDRKRYAETKQLDITTTVKPDIRAILEERDRQINSLIEGTCTVVPTDTEDTE